MGRSGSFLRRSAVLAAVVAAFAAVAASASAAQLGVVAEYESNQVSLISTATNKIVGSPIKVGKGPSAVAITTDGKFAFVPNREDNTVSVIELGLRRNLGSPIEVGKGPFGIAITPDGQYAYVTDRLSNEVSVISTQTRKLVKSIPVGGGPTGIAISPTGKTALVSDSVDGTVQVIDTTTMTVEGEPIEVGESPMGIEFTPAGTAFVVDEFAEEVSAVDPLTRSVTGIPLEVEGRAISVSPDGTKAYVVGVGRNEPISVIDTGMKEVTGEVPLEGETQEVAFSANGKTAYVTEAADPESPAQVQTIDVQGGKVAGSAIPMPGDFPDGIALTPDQSPVAAFTPPSATVGVPAPFSGSSSTDADGTIASYIWTFEDGRNATGVSAVHAFAAPGTFNAKLTVVDDEGCGEAVVFTGRTAYCSGGPSSVSHPVVVKPAPGEEATPPVCKSAFGVGGLSHNRKNGTARLRVNLHTAGSLLLFGRTVHAVTRKAKAAGSMMLTIHARVELNKRLKKIHHARVPIRITFTPSSGCGYKTVHRTLQLLRAPKHRH
jgi:YVTN family beta-propeller protein